MATWLFRTPLRVTDPLDGSHPLWRRVYNRQGVALVKHADGTWAEYPVLPQTLDANADYLFGRSDRSAVPRGKGFGVSQDGRGNNLETPEDREFRSPLRIFRGGHDYKIDDAMKAELEAATTTEQPSGYGAYISASSGEVTGDEIQASGRTAEFEQPTS